MSRISRLRRAERQKKKAVDYQARLRVWSEGRARGHTFVPGPGKLRGFYGNRKLHANFVCTVCGAAVDAGKVPRFDCGTQIVYDVLFT